MIEDLNRRLSKLNVFDIGQVKWACVVFGIIITKLFPQLLQINYVILIVLMLALSAFPTYKFWIKK
jgi:hypothetical protein